MINAYTCSTRNCLPPYSSIAIHNRSREWRQETDDANGHFRRRSQQHQHLKRLVFVRGDMATTTSQGSRVCDDHIFCGWKKVRSDRSHWYCHQTWREYHCAGTNCEAEITITQFNVGFLHIHRLCWTCAGRPIQHKLWMRRKPTE